MKVENHVFVNQMEEKRKLGSGKKVKGFLPNLPGGIKLKNGNLQKDTVSFGSPVISKEIIKHDQHPIFLNRLTKFIDKFEDEIKRRKKIPSNKKYNSTIDSQLMSALYLGSGMSGNAYILYDFLHAVDQDIIDYINIQYSIVKNTILTLTDGHTKFVIKETQKSHQKDIEHEFEELKKVVDMPNMQQGVALMKTSDGGTFLISEFHPGIPKGLNKKNGTKTFNPLTSNNIRDFLNVLSNLDKKMLFNPDLNLGNILYDNEVPTIIDLEWQTNMNNAEKVFTFMPNEKKTNMVAFESSGLSAYIKDLYKTNKNIKLSYMNNKKSCRDFLKMYFMERAKHCDTSNRFERIRKAVYQNPSEDVLDAEILRLSILKNQEKQFTYLDKNIEKPRDMLKMIRYQATGNFAAKMLSEFQPQKPYSETSRAEDEYFEEMRNFGKKWYQNTQEWYKGSIEWMKNLVLSNGRCQNNNTGYFYFPEKFGKGYKKEQNAEDSPVSDKTMLSNVLSDGAKAKWDEVMERDETINYRGRNITLPSIKTQIITFEGKFMALKQAVDENIRYLKYDILDNIEYLIPEVLV